jgi:hypothetical protein
MRLRSPAFLLSFAALAFSQATASADPPHLRAGQHALVQPAGRPVPLFEAPLFRNPAAVPPAVKAAAVARAAARGARPRLSAFRRPTSPGGSKFIADDAGFIFQFSSRGPGFGRLTGVIDDCSGPEGLKVDRRHDLWAACTNSATVQEYAPGATTATLTYDDTINGVPYYVAAVTVDDIGNVYASSLYAFQCTTSSCTYYPGQISYWLAGDPDGATPDGQIADANINQEAFFLDIDPPGSNLYVSYEGCNSSMCGYGVDKLTGNPKAGWAATPFLPIGSLGFAGGIAVETYGAEAGDVLVGDQMSRSIGQYDADGVPTGTVYGPLPQNQQGTCDAVAFGLSKHDKFLLAGDAGCQAADEGRLSTNAFTTYTNIDFSLPIDGAFFDL